MLEGLLFGRTAPPRDERELIGMPALVIGHPSDPLHPFSTPTCSSRRCRGRGWSTPSRSSSGACSPGRLDDELAEFLAEVYAAEPASAAGRRLKPLAP